MANSHVMGRIREGLLEKRQRLADWLQNTPPSTRRLREGTADDHAVQAHLSTLDTAIEKTENETLGICEVCQGRVEPGLLEMDYTACVCLDHLSPQQTRDLEAELELAAVVQRALLPQSVPEIPGMQLAAFSRPAQIVGGDYFDFFRFRDGAHGLAIGDVAGHGMSTSLLMASLQTTLRALVPVSASPAEVVQQAHRLFCHNVHFTTFVTLFLGAMDPATGALTYCNAGHNPPLILKAGGDYEYLPPTGPAIGLVEDTTFQPGDTRLDYGDALVLYTDGITEATEADGEQFGTARLADSARAAAGSARGLLAAVRDDLATFAGGRPLVDDATLLVVRRATQ